MPSKRPESLDSRREKVIVGAKFSNAIMRIDWADFENSVDVEDLVNRTLERFTEDGGNGHHIAIHVLEEVFAGWSAGVQHHREQVQEI
jgi:hypothetical protein